MEKLAYSIRETADALGLSKATVLRMVQQGQLQAVRVGTGKGRFIVPRSSLDELLTVRVA